MNTRGPHKQWLKTTANTWSGSSENHTTYFVSQSSQCHFTEKKTEAEWHKFTFPKLTRGVSGEAKTQKPGVLKWGAQFFVKVLHGDHDSPITHGQEQLQS